MVAFDASSQEQFEAEVLYKDTAREIATTDVSGLAYDGGCPPHPAYHPGYPSAAHAPCAQSPPGGVGGLPAGAVVCTLQWQVRCALPSHRGRRAIALDPPPGAVEGLRKAITRKVKQQDGSEHVIRIVQLFKEGYEYQMDYGALECRREHLRSKFSYHSIATNATYIGDYNIGATAGGGSALEIEAWRAVHTTDDGETLWRGTFTRHGCLPVRTVVLYPDGHVLSESLFNIRLGIANTSVFDIDEEICPKPHNLARPGW